MVSVATTDCLAWKSSGPPTRSVLNRPSGQSDACVSAQTAHADARYCRHLLSSVIVVVVVVASVAVKLSAVAGVGTVSGASAGRRRVLQCRWWARRGGVGVGSGRITRPGGRRRVLGGVGTGTGCLWVTQPAGLGAWVLPLSLGQPPLAVGLCAGGDAGGGACWRRVAVTCLGYILDTALLAANTRTGTRGTIISDVHNDCSNNHRL